MKTMPKIVVIVLIVGALAVALYQTFQTVKLRDQMKALQQQQEQQTNWATQVQAIKRERDQATNQLELLAKENAALKKNPTEVHRLRGEVGRLRQDYTSLGSSNAISKVTANPEARKILRDQQKLGMGYIYKGLSKQLKLSEEQTEKLNDLLADHIMDNVNNVTTVLRDKPSTDQMNEVFATQEARLQEKVLALVGQEGLGQFQDYSNNLLSTLSTEQFKGQLTGTGEEKEAKAKQFQQAMREAIQMALVDAGLPADYQTVPILNFRNIASETAAEQNLKLMDGIYQQAAARAKSFLSAEELKKFEEFRTAALNNSRSALTLNRTMMAPILE